MDLRIRKAKKSDSKDIIKLIKELAHFEKLDPPNAAAQKRLLSDAFKRNPPFRIILAFDGKTAVGYAFYFFSYSTFLAKPTLYLEDIYISDRCRGYGVGKKLMNELVKIAKEKKCGRLEWIVLDWNKNAIDFYDRFGAKHMNNWYFYRYTL